VGVHNADAGPARERGTLAPAEQRRGSTEPNDDAGAALAWFLDELRCLRRHAGSPSLNQLAAVSQANERPLRRSTLSDKLTGKSLPDWDFVVSFVAACATHAETAGQPLPARLTELGSWDAAHLRMLRAVDSTRAAQRLVASARTELENRPGWAGPAGQVVPRQLPTVGWQFAGRAAELARLDSLLDGAGAAHRAVVVVVDGMAGVGKTALAVHWVHRVVDRFPDGQLYVELRGSRRRRARLQPKAAVTGVLDALGVPPEQVPADLDSCVAMFRSVIAGRRVAIILDDAADAEQVRPLLPGSAGCLVVITSRSRLPSLVAKEGAHPVMLGLLSVDEARDLLLCRVGRDRADAELGSVIAIATRCAQLPLALAVVAARAAANPRFPLAALERELARRYEPVVGHRCLRQGGWRPPGPPPSTRDSCGASAGRTPAGP
jgi:NB-ARC domain